MHATWPSSCSQRASYHRPNCRPYPMHYSVNFLAVFLEIPAMHKLQWDKTPKLGQAPSCLKPRILNIKFNSSETANDLGLNAMKIPVSFSFIETNYECFYGKIILNFQITFIWYRMFHKNFIFAIRFVAFFLFSLTPTQGRHCNWNTVALSNCHKVVSSIKCEPALRATALEIRKSIIEIPFSGRWPSGFDRYGLWFHFNICTHGYFFDAYQPVLSARITAMPLQKLKTE